MDFEKFTERSRGFMQRPWNQLIQAVASVDTQGESRRTLAQTVQQLNDFGRLVVADGIEGLQRPVVNVRAFPYARQFSDLGLCVGILRLRFVHIQQTVERVVYIVAMLFQLSCKRRPVRRPHTDCQAQALEGCGGQLMGLLVIDFLQTMLGLPQEGIRGCQFRGHIGLDIAMLHQRAKRF